MMPTNLDRANKSSNSLQTRAFILGEWPYLNCVVEAISE